MAKDMRELIEVKQVEGKDVECVIAFAKEEGTGLCQLQLQGTFPAIMAGLTPVVADAINQLCRDQKLPASAQRELLDMVFKHCKERLDELAEEDEKRKEQEDENPLKSAIDSLGELLEMLRGATK